tara:strand:+ start:2238 stop:2741 length:504 start_codon:yes stop_codon:yes gene_type:complete
MIRDEFINHEFFWFIGAVEDIDDTELYARVKVRPYGYYETEANGGPTKDELPWATVLLPNTSASKAGVGSTHALLVGSWVVGFFRDGRSAQDPIIIGSIPTQTDGTKDVPTDDIKKKTHVTESGHTVIFDDTPGNIQIVHQAGSSITMDAEGGITIVSKPGQKTKIV